MKAIRTLPRFRCDYCRKTGVAATIKKHERWCFRNPKRFCDACQNTGKISKVHCLCGLEEMIEGIPCTCPKYEEECPHCVKYRKFLLNEQAKEHHFEHILTGGF